MTLLIGSIQLGLMYALLSLGVYITFRILNIPDLTADGSFTLGLSVSAFLTVNGHPFLGLIAAVLAGAAAGAITGLLQTKLKIHPILAGILTMSGLYSINLFVLGNRSNLSLIDCNTLFSLAEGLFPSASKGMANIIILIVAFLICCLVTCALTFFFKTHLGLCIRATGDNEAMVRSSSINVDSIKILALAVSNGCVALSGAVITQYQGFADISSGVGMVVVGLASVIIGETFLGRRSVTIGLVSAVTGAVAYRLMIALALKTRIFPAYALKLVSAVIVIIALSIPPIKEAIRLMKQKKGAKSNA